MQFFWRFWNTCHFISYFITNQITSFCCFLNYSFWNSFYCIYCWLFSTIKKFLAIFITYIFSNFSWMWTHVFSKRQKSKSFYIYSLGISLVSIEYPIFLMTALNLSFHVGANILNLLSLYEVFMFFLVQ